MLFRLPTLLLAASATLLSACSNDDKSSSSSLTGFDNSIYSHLTATEATVCAQTKTGILKCWGNGDDYSFANGIDGTIGDDVADIANGGFPASQLGDEAPVYAMAGYRNGCALYEGGVLKCWGVKTSVGLNDLSADSSDYVGDTAEELGNNLPVIDLGTGLTVSSFSVGDAHICAVLNNGRLKCWGNGRDGRLGYGDEAWRGNDNDEMGDNLPYVDLGTDESGTPYTVKQVDAGYDRTCAILNNDQVKCWGDNNYAESGYGDFNERGDEANEMGNNLPFVDLGTGRSAKQIFAYYVHTCAILDNDALKCWGSNNDGEIGLATDDFIVGNNTPYYNKYLCSDDATVPLYSITAEPAGDICEFGGYRYEYGTDSNGNEVLDSDEISLGSNYLCNRRDVNAVYAISSFAANSQQACGTSAGLHLTHDFDSDGDGQLAQGDVNMMGDALPEIDFGSSAAVVDVVQGDDHTCALLADTTLKCWGINEYGQLGLDNTINNFGDGANEIPAAQTEVDLGTDKYAVAIAGAYNFTCALLNTDEIKCWGYDDDYGTLGVIDYYDTTIGDGNPAPEMGDALQAVPVFVSDES